MIIKSFEFKKIDIKKYNLYLFYGENEGQKKELIENKFKIFFKNKTYNYEENYLLNNEKEFFDTILTKSFFDNEKLIIISGVTNKLHDIINQVLEKNIEDTFIILVSDKLEKKTKLRNLFEKEKNLICVPFYTDNFQSLSYIAKDFFKKINIPVSQEILNILVERANGDRQSLKNEMNKIESFTLNKKKIEINEILKLTNLNEKNNISELVDICLAKNEKKLLKMINENNFSNEDTVLIIRTFLFKAKRLLSLQEEVEINNNIDTVLNTFKPPIFWKDKDLIKQQINNYSKSNVKILINTINKTELLIKKNYNSSINILLDFIISQGKRVNNSL